MCLGASLGAFLFFLALYYLVHGEIVVLENRGFHTTSVITENEPVEIK